jgi:ATP-binding cassette subfamily B multidrug efflux pump
LRGPLRSIFDLIWRYKGRVLLGIACLLIVDGAQLAVPLVIRKVVDALASSSATPAFIGAQSLVLLGLALAVAVFRFAWRHFFFSASRLAELDLRNRILDHALALSTRFFTKTRTGEIMALATNDVESVRQAIAMGFVAGFDGSVYALVAIGAMLWLDPVLCLWTILPLPLLAALMAVSLKAVYSRWDAVQASFEDLTEKVRETAAGMRVLRAYGQQEGDADDFDRFNRDYYGKYMRYVAVDAFFHPAILLVAGSCLAILLGVGGGRVLEGKTSIGSFVAFSSYLAMLTWPMIAAGWMLSLMQRAGASMARIQELLGVTDLDGAGGDGSLRKAPAKGALEAKGLTFTYPEASAPALKGVSFSLPAGGSVGIVGEIGSGKSTLAQLIVRIYDPPEGTLFLDGEDLRSIPVAYLRESVAYVPQEPFLFSDTIAQNLRLANPGATQEEMERVCAIAALHEEIVSFPRGYETVLGERGITLSGGQKQRLCLARALLKPSPVLVLDDTLSAVDADAERRILAGLRTLARDRTLVVVSHRVSAVRELDTILCLHRGEVIQAGTHAQLAAAPGYYQQMVELQEMEQ